MEAAHSADAPPMSQSLSRSRFIEVEELPPNPRLERTGGRPNSACRGVRGRQPLKRQACAGHGTELER